jgi:hypothetical protein
MKHDAFSEALGHDKARRLGRLPLADSEDVHRKPAVADSGAQAAGLRPGIRDTRLDHEEVEGRARTSPTSRVRAEQDDARRRARGLAEAAREIANRGVVN